MLTQEDLFAEDHLEDNADLDVIVEQHESDDNAEPEDNVEVVERQENDEQQQDANVASTKAKRVVRNPLPKLNADTLKGPRGIHILPDIFSKVKFKPPGCEEENLNLLMKTYEYWCHRLFPKLPFDDCLEKIETLGNKKPVQTHLKKIRMDLLVEDNPTESHSDQEQDREVADDSDNAETEPVELTEEQLERIRINKEKAMRIRMERLQRTQAATLESAGTTDLDMSVQPASDDDERVNTQYSNRTDCDENPPVASQNSNTNIPEIVTVEVHRSNTQDSSDEEDSIVRKKSANRGRGGNRIESSDEEIDGADKNNRSGPVHLESVNQSVENISKYNDPSHISVMNSDDEDVDIDGLLESIQSKQ